MLKKTPFIYVIDPHVHSSPSTVYDRLELASTESMVSAAKNKGLNGILFAEHNILSVPVKWLVSGFGVELSTTSIDGRKPHIIAVFKSFKKIDHLIYAETSTALKSLKNMGAFIIAAHPNPQILSLNLLSGFYSLTITEILNYAQEGLIDGVEVGTQIGSLSKKTINLLNERGLLCLGASDSHYPHQIGNTFTTIQSSKRFYSFFDLLRYAKDNPSLVSFSVRPSFFSALMTFFLLIFSKLRFLLKKKNTENSPLDYDLDLNNQ